MTPMAEREDENIERIEAAFSEVCYPEDCAAAQDGGWFINAEANAECKVCGRTILLVSPV